MGWLQRIVMPGEIDGFQLVKIAKERHPGIKVLMTTGYDFMLRNAYPYEREFGTILHKPYRAQQRYLKAQGSATTVQIGVFRTYPRRPCGAHALLLGGQLLATILLVEDDPDVLDALAAMARASGHKVVEAESGYRALELLNSDHRFDLLLTDAVMSGLDGFNLARIAKARHHGLRILSAYDPNVVALRDAGSQFGKLLTKPIGAAELQKEINGALSMLTPQ